MSRNMRTGAKEVHEGEAEGAWSTVDVGVAVAAADMVLTAAVTVTVVR